MSRLFYHVLPQNASVFIIVPPKLLKAGAAPKSDTRFLLCRSEVVIVVFLVLLILLVLVVLLILLILFVLLVLVVLLILVLVVHTGEPPSVSC